MYKTLLLAADGSENSFRAAKESMNFIDANTRVTILNVVGTDDVKNEVLHGSQSGNVTARRKEKLSRILDFYEKNGITYEVVFEHGSPSDTVVNVANNGAFEALVLGTRGLNNFQEMMLGSVSHKAAKRVTIPVLIVK
ncbi:universal stress protein [Salinicoccus sediminis]|uniref:Universal stress protein n=1 Tax=Salinicoccus sediminis TaxID=1432562 RepID=A0A0M2SLR9_9STAP|nr:universal stress protein [Salinicoccus sediminis]KKK33540.1 universal stress protein [Salinicoccus sediminis]